MSTSSVIIDEVIGKPELRQVVVRKVRQCVVTDGILDGPLPICWVESEDQRSFEIRVLDEHAKCCKDHTTGKMKNAMTRQCMDALKELGIYDHVDVHTFKVAELPNPVCDKVYRTSKTPVVDKPARMDKCCLHQFHVRRKKRTKRITIDLEECPESQ